MAASEPDQTLTSFLKTDRCAEWAPGEAVQGLVSDGCQTPLWKWDRGDPPYMKDLALVVAALRDANNVLIRKVTALSKGMRRD